MQATETDPVTLVAKGTTPGHATIILNALDANDNPPTFITDHLFGSVSESARVGDVAAAGVRAFDRDEVWLVWINFFCLIKFNSPLS